MGKTKIEWADAVWNPTIGCTKVSAGCTNCYAERMAARLKAMGRPEYQDVVDDKGRWTGKIVLLPERLNQPLHWLKPKRIFVDSMSDLFHPSVNFAYIEQILKVMVMANQHTFIILTKRPELMLEFTKRIAGTAYIAIAEWPRNVWLGVSVENQEAADERIPLLLQTPAAVRIVSAEPLLSDIDFTKVIMPDGDHLGPSLFNHGCGAGIDWIICGGESGPNARPMHPDWARGLRNQCRESNVPFFFKQWGKWVPNYIFVAKEIANKLLNGKEYHEFPGGS